MITRRDCISWILTRVPGFQKRWQAHLDYWQGEEAGLCNDIAEFSDYAVELIKNRRTSEIRAVFELVENLMVEGDDTVKDAAATCFLENLLNQASAGNTSSSAFVDLLGPESRAYCKAWDEFTGVQTEGL